MTRLRRPQGDEGFSLVELSVAMLIFSVLSATLMSAVLTSKDAAQSSRQSHDLNEEARVAINRMARELRQAKEIRGTSAPDGATSMTMGVDFNGNSTVDSSTIDPEILTYSYDAANKRITLTANDETGTAITRPILASNVESFRLDYFSSDYRRDCEAPKGRTNWRELDKYTTTCSPRAASNGELDASERPSIDIVTIEISVLTGARRQEYRTTVDLRNAL